MTREDHIRMSNGYEAIFRPKVESILNRVTGSVLSHLRHNGIDATIHWVKFNGITFPKGMVADIHTTAGTRAAQLEDREMWTEVRKSQKRFSQIEWVQFIRNYLQVYLLEKASTDIADTTKALLLKF